jgi:hypothetical protein
MKQEKQTYITVAKTPALPPAPVLMKFFHCLNAIPERVLPEITFRVAFFVLVFLTAWLPGFYQMLDTRPSWIETTPLRFDPRFITEKKIKWLEVSNMDKPDGSPIIDQGLKEFYRFDEKGNVAMYYKTRVKSKELVEKEIPALYKKGKLVRKAYTKEEHTYFYDTTFYWFKYDTIGRIIMKKTKVADFFFAWYYEYDINGFIGRQTYVKETIPLSQSEESMAASPVQTILSDEYFKYSFQSPSQLRKSYLNDEGKEYRYAIINFDRTFIEENHAYKTGYVKHYYLYRFDEKGKLSEFIRRSNANEEITFKTTYEYSATGELMAERYYKEDTFTNEITWMYEKDTGLIKARLDRDFIGMRIGITKYLIGY